MRRGRLPARASRVIARTGVRWQLVAWVLGVLLAVCAVTFAVVYEQTGNQLRAQIDEDVQGDVSALSQAVRDQHPQSPAALLRGVGAYIRAQPFSATSTLLFAAIPGHGTATNHAELVGSSPADGGESPAQQAHENEIGAQVISGPTGLSTRRVPDLGQTRFYQRELRVGARRVRVGAGEPLIVVTRAERSMARSFIIAGAVALVVALIASYLAGAALSRPLRRMARVAARVDEGDLHPRMQPTGPAGTEIHILADSFNRMLDRLAAAFATQREFIADASHELRTPLTVIAGQLEVLAASPDPRPDEVQRVQRLVAAEIARTSRLVDDMLLLARSDRRDFLHRQQIDLEPFISELWWSASLANERHFELGPIPSATLTADPDRLAQALRNLIRNAIEHTIPSHGLVRLEIQSLGDHRVRFTVIDDGPGIPEDQLDRVFDRFHRTDGGRGRKSGGAGLGLAIVLAIAQAHGGTARAVPAATGARLELELPHLHVHFPRRPTTPTAHSTL